MSRPYHVPVLLDEVVRLLAPVPGAVFVDGTLGGGGHAYKVAERLVPGGTLVVFDQDPAAMDEALPALRTLDLNILPISANYRNLSEELDVAGIGAISGMLLDLGVSSRQLDEGERGFSFRADAPLDMRMRPTGGETAGDFLSGADERAIERVIREYGEERWAARIAKYIVEERRSVPIRTTGQLARIVEAAIPRAAWPPEIHPASRTFLALRILVNDELAALQEGLDQGIDRLKAGGRFAVIAYHSLEDRIVKRTFARMSGQCQCPPGLPACQCGSRRVVRILTRKPSTPSELEKRDNPRSRSARLRVVEKL